MDAPHVEYVLLAEFDIDKGSVLRHEYPQPTGYDEGFLSELMLPEGAHNRPEDSTVFFLRRDKLTGTRRKSNVAKPPSNHEAELFKRRIPATILRFDDSSGEWLAFGREDPTHVMVTCTLHPPTLVALPRSSPDPSTPREALLSVDISAEIELRCVQAEFLSFKDKNGQSIGMVFECKEDQDHISQCITKLINHQQQTAADQSSVSSQAVSSTSEEVPDPLTDVTCSALEKGTLCCLNIVQTRKLKKARRGAVVKALAICTVHRFFHVFQPFLHMTLEKLYVCDAEGTSSVPCLQELYQQLNSLTLEDMPYITPLEKQLNWLLRTKKMPPSLLTSPPSLSPITQPQPNPSQTSSHPLSLATPTPEPQQQQQQQQQQQTGQGDSENIREEGIEVETEADGTATVSDGNVTPKKKPPQLPVRSSKVGGLGWGSPAPISDVSASPRDKEVSGTGFVSRARNSLTGNVRRRSLFGMSPVTISERDQFHVAHIQYDAMPVPVHVPLLMEPDEAGPISVKVFVQKFRARTMVIYNGLLMGARILFIGHGMPAGDVARFVLSACVLCSPPLTGALSRAFPFATLACLDFLEVPGFIAGVTNPMFGDHKNWWDILCDLSDGRVEVSEKFVSKHRDYSLIMKKVVVVGRSVTEQEDKEAVDVRETAVPESETREGSDFSLADEGSGDESGAVAPLPDEMLSFTQDFDTSASKAVPNQTSGMEIASPPPVIDASMFPVPSTSNVPFSPPAARGNADWDLVEKEEHSTDTARGALLLKEKIDAWQTDLDMSFINNVLSCIESNGDEMWIRSLFRDYTQHILDVALDQVEFANQTQRNRNVVGNAFRITAMKQTEEFRRHVKLMQQRQKQSPHYHLLGKHIRRLRVCKNLSESDLIEIYRDFRAIVSEDNLHQFLSHLSPTQGGLFPVAVSLFHSSDHVKHEVVSLLQKLDRLKVGSRLVNSLNMFLLLTYHRSVTKTALAPPPSDPK